MSLKRLNGSVARPGIVVARTLAALVAVVRMVEMGMMAERGLVRGTPEKRVGLGVGLARGMMLERAVRVRLLERELLIAEAMMGMALLVVLWLVLPFVGLEGVIRRFSRFGFVDCTLGTCLAAPEKLQIGNEEIAKTYAEGIAMGMEVGRPVKTVMKLVELMLLMTVIVGRTEMDVREVGRTVVESMAALVGERSRVARRVVRVGSCIVAMRVFEGL